jgi:hypothetical protein
MRGSGFAAFSSQSFEIPVLDERRQVFPFKGFQFWLPVVLLGYPVDKIQG